MLTPRGRQAGHSVRVTSETSRVVIVRAWRDSHRIVIRVLTAGGHTEPTDEWVFADIGEACDRVGEVLRQLVDPGSSAA